VSPATWPREDPLQERLLVIDPGSGGYQDASVGGMGGFLRRGDLLVVNDAATMPASLPASGPRGERLELRLAAHLEGSSFAAVLFGDGDWRTPTEHRPPPPSLAPGASLRVGVELTADITAVSPLSPPLLTLRFGEREPARLWDALYRHGRPVQYAYLERPLSLWHVQNRYAGRPWAVELPSAGRPLTWALLDSFRKQGVRLASITHAAGLSSTGDEALDAALPLPERYDIPATTVDDIARARADGGRVVAVGTSVVRALEGAARGGAGRFPRLVPGEGTTSLRIGPGFQPAVVDGLLTGMHEKGASHFALLHAFAPAALIAEAYALASSRGYLEHEFGDTNLILAA
jgi:S-adenosylmethionine:tRNA ribosyltransferase-isomerase